MKLGKITAVAYLVVPFFPFAGVVPTKDMM
jgi:hypothetical protein